MLWTRLIDMITASWNWLAYLNVQRNEFHMKKLKARLRKCWESLVIPPDSALFGREKDNSFRSSLDTIYQTFDGKDLYPSIEEKAAHLLYFIVKNHSLYKSDGMKRIADNALVALTLMIAMSDPKEKDVITKIIVNLINKDN
ncbi:MAG: hypothetical protein JRC90_03330 [Deltaproteobacteria bacterium]|nr:hypothetical protein [Deltaproteobacteria bacterium]